MWEIGNGNRENDVRCVLNVLRSKAIDFLLDDG
jgi:hypothetical protein